MGIYKRSTALFYLIFPLLFIFQLNIHLVLAGSTGKINGKVIDSETGDPLPGANVIIEGTTLGAAADNDGDYFILNVPPGNYNIKASMMGYETVKQIGVRVYIDKTITVNFSLSTKFLETGEIIVIAEKPIIQADIANTQSVLTSEDISAIPVLSFKDVLDKQVGVRESDARGLFLRGEGEYAISLKIDGLETRDNIDNQIETRINPDAVEEANIITGGFSPEHGNAGSGVVNIVLKEGKDKYEATFSHLRSIPKRKHFGPPLRYYYDQRFDNPEFWEVLATNRRQLTGVYEPFFGKPELLRELYFWRMRDEVSKYGDKSDVIYSGTFGGPIPLLKNITFFLSGLYEKTYYLFNQAQPFYDNLNLSAKITTHITPDIKLNFTARYTELSGINRYDRREFSGAIDPSRIANPDQTRENRYVFESVEDIAWAASVEQTHLSPWPYVDKMSISNRFKNAWSLKLTHALSAKSFYEVYLMYNSFRIYGAPPPLRDTTQTVTLTDSQGNFATLGGALASAPGGFWPKVLQDPLGIASISLGGTFGNVEISRDKTFILKTNFISQLNKTNQLNLGFEFTYIDLFKDELRAGIDNKRYMWKWHIFPKTIGAWILNKFEFQGMRANAGLRVDIRIPHHSWPDFNNNRYDYHWSYDTRAGVLIPDSIFAGPLYKPPVKWVLSPRISISHPIGTDAKIFFNYAHQNQNPPYENLYRIQIRSDIPSWDVFGNPELPYVKTIHYEVGYEQNIADLIFAAVSGYYREVKNKLAETLYDGENREINGITYQTDYRVYSPDLYSTARGLEIRLQKRAGKFWTGWFNYDYQIFTSSIKGFREFNEEPTEPPTLRNSNIFTNMNRKLTPLPRFNAGLNLRTPDSFGPSVSYFRPFSGLRLDLLFWWRSQPTFTYNPNNLQAPYAPRDNKRWTAHHGTNLTLSKRFNFVTGVTPVFTIQIYNLFNTKNMFRGAFSPAERNMYIALLEEHGGRPGEKQDLAMQAIENQPEVEGPGFTPYDLFLNPRQIFFGLRFEIK